MHPPRGTATDKYESWMRHLPARAYDNSLFVAACNQVGSNKNGLTFPGVALLINPSGQVIKKQLTDDENVMVADLAAEDINRVRCHKMRYFLPNRRSDIYVKILKFCTPILIKAHRVNL